MEAYKKDKEFMELVGHLIQHPRFQKLDNIPQHHYSTHGAWRTFTRFLLLRLARNQV